MRWRIELMGGLRVLGEQRRIDRFETRQMGLLLAYMAYYRDRAHAREALVELLWPACEPRAGRNRLSVSLSWLRRRLDRPEHRGSPPSGQEAERLILADRASVRLNPHAFTTDVAAFETALVAAREADGAERAQRLTHAVALYGGDLLTGADAEWIAPERARLAESYAGAIRQLVAHLEARGELQQALQFAYQSLAADPLREACHRDVMRLLARMGQPEAALRRYGVLERLLSEELDTAPSAATRALAREIVRSSVLCPSTTISPLPDPESRSSGPPAGEKRLMTIFLPALIAPGRGAAGEKLTRLARVLGDALLRYGGEIARAPDGRPLVLFGAAQVHEDDPERALRAALDLREEGHRLGLPVASAVATGCGTLKWHSGQPDAPERESAPDRSLVCALAPLLPPASPRLDLSGPVIDLAWRIERRLAPGEILCDEATGRHTRRAFQFLRSAPAGRTAIYAVDGARPRTATENAGAVANTDLIGRDEELAKLQAVLARLTSRPGGHAAGGQMILVVGEAGIGKSRLASELRRRKAGAKEWLVGRCREWGIGIDYGLFADLFQRFLAGRTDEISKTLLERLAACLGDRVTGGDMEPGRAREIETEIGRLLSPRISDPARAVADRERMLLAVRDLLVALARRQPVVAVLEDLQWADARSMDLLVFLMETLPDAPLLLLCLCRPEWEHQCRHLGTVASRICPDRFTEVRLHALTRPQSRRIVEQLLGAEPVPDAVFDFILERGQGNPFFLMEVTRALIADGLLQPRERPFQAESFSVPPTIQRVFLSRCDRLPPYLREVIECAAVIGCQFPRSLLQRVVEAMAIPEPPAAPDGASAGRVEPALRALEDRGFLYRTRVLPEEAYAFYHRLAQETILQNLTPGRRDALCRHVAAAKDGEPQ